MKKILVLICAALLLSVALCSCMKDTMDQAATMMTELGEDIKDAVDDATTADNDGFIGNESEDVIENESRAKEEEEASISEEYDDEMIDTTDETREYVSGTQDSFM